MAQGQYGEERVVTDDGLRKVKDLHRRGGEDDPAGQMPYNFPTLTQLSLSHYNLYLDATQSS